jgi:L-alanine-DL-glutamate epimerase-like enolase superfamily enzyme
MGWMLRLFEGVAALENGELILSDRPGLGLTFNEETIKRFGAAA